MKVSTDSKQGTNIEGISCNNNDGNSHGKKEILSDDQDLIDVEISVHMTNSDNKLRIRELRNRNVGKQIMFKDTCTKVETFW